MYIGTYVCIIAQVHKIKLHQKVQAKFRKLNSSQASENATAPEFMHEQNQNGYKFPYSFILKDVFFLILSFFGRKYCSNQNRLCLTFLAILTSACFCKSSFTTSTCPIPLAAYRAVWPSCTKLHTQKHIYSITTAIAYIHTYIS